MVMQNKAYLYQKNINYKKYRNNLDKSGLLMIKYKPVGMR